MPSCNECQRKIGTGEEHVLASDRPFCTACAKRIFSDIMPGGARRRRDAVAMVALYGTALLGITATGMLMWSSRTNRVWRTRSGGATSHGAQGVVAAGVLVGTMSVCAFIYRMTFGQFRQADAALERVSAGKRTPLVTGSDPLTMLWSRRRVVGPLLAIVAGGMAIKWRSQPRFVSHVLALGETFTTPYGLDVALSQVRGAGLRLHFGNAEGGVDYVDVQPADVGVERQTLGFLWKVTAVERESVTVTIHRP